MVIIIQKRNHARKPILRYQGKSVLSHTADSICIECVFDRDIPGDTVNISAGDRAVEWFFTDRWYNIFEYHDVSDDHLKGWYCNITRPSQVLRDEGLFIAWDDLALDVFISPDGAFHVLDEDELDALNLPAAELVQVWAAVDQLRGLVEQRLAPFETIPKSR